MGRGYIRSDNRALPRADKPAHRPVSNGLLILASCAFLVWLCLDFRRAFPALFAVMAWVSVAFALLRLAACFTPKPMDHGLADITDDLPRYTVLIPLFHEAQMVPQIIRAMSALRYASEKLEVLLITEAVDPFTTNAVQDALASGHQTRFRQVVVPPGSPQTKPRALNFAMQSAQGELVTIYDAEDIPNPYQLLAAVNAFRARSDWSAVQAPLDYHNTDVNCLTRQFTLEYAVLFHVWVPFLAHLGLPFPLGGTSNHMRGLM